MLESRAYKHTRALASRVLAMFGSTYICEHSFSRMSYIKSKVRSRLNQNTLSALLRISTGSIDQSGMLPAQRDDHSTADEIVEVTFELEDPLTEAMAEEAEQIWTDIL